MPIGSSVVKQAASSFIAADTLASVISFWQSPTSNFIKQASMPISSFALHIPLRNTAARLDCKETTDDNKHGLEVRFLLRSSLRYTFFSFPVKVLLLRMETTDVKKHLVGDPCLSLRTTYNYTWESASLHLNVLNVSLCQHSFNWLKIFLSSLIFLHLIEHKSRSGTDLEQLRSWMWSVKI